MKKLKVGFYGLLRTSARAPAAAVCEQQALSHPKKISSLTLKTFGPEVTVCYPVKRNKCMSDLGKCWELNCIKALSLPELQSNWIKLEKQLPMCMNPFFLWHRDGPHVPVDPVFCPCQHSPNEIPKIRR